MIKIISMLDIDGLYKTGVISETTKFQFNAVGMNGGRGTALLMLDAACDTGAESDLESFKRTFINSLHQEEGNLGYLGAEWAPGVKGAALRFALNDRMGIHSFELVGSASPVVALSKGMMCCVDSADAIPNAAGVAIGMDAGLYAMENH